jgi:hypothetical protein
MYPKRDKDDCLIFKDHLEFRPNKTPKEMFNDGIMSGTYFRPIHSSITNKNYKNIHKKYTFLNQVPISKMTLGLDKADKTINKYKVHVGTTLEFWESKGWIHKEHPYGWIHWYCDFYMGVRGPDDQRQIKRWLGIAGPKGRFRLNLLNQIKASNDYSISPRIRQTLLHWAFEI